MSFFGNDPLSSFLGGTAKATPAPTPAPQPVEKSKEDYNNNSAVGNFFDEWVAKPVGSAMKWTGENVIEPGVDMTKIGWNFLTTDDPFNVKGKQTKYLDDMFAQKDEEKVKQKKVEDRATSLQSTFVNAFRNELQTNSPYKRNIMVNDIQEATKQYTDLLSTIDSMDGIERTRTAKTMPGLLKSIGMGTSFQTKDEYKQYLMNEIIPAQQELLRRKYKYLDGQGSTYAYNKSMEDEGSEELADKISDFSNNLQADSNTAALKNFQQKGDKFGMTLAFAGKQFDNFRYFTAKTGIGGSDIVNEFKYTDGGSAQDSGELAKTGYGAIKNLWELYDGAPSVISQIPAFVSGVGAETAMTKIPGALESLGALSKSDKIIKTIDTGLDMADTFSKNHKIISTFAKEMLTDTMIYDPASQVFLGRGMNEEDIKENMLWNLPINLGIGAMARSTKTAQALAEQYDVSKTFSKDGTINLTHDELQLIKEGKIDAAQMLILNRSKVGAELPENLINVRQLSGDNRLAKDAVRTGQGVQDMLQRVAAKTESTADTLKLSTATADNIITSDVAKTQQNIHAFEAQIKASKELEKTILTDIPSENSNKFWNAKVTQAAREGRIDINQSLNNFVKANPEYAAAAQMYRKVNNIAPDANFKFDANTINTKKITRQFGEMLKGIFQDDVAMAGKLVEGDRLSPIHVFKDGQVKNIETGSSMPISDFFKKTQKSTYQKKAMNQTVIDDLAGRLDIFAHFNKKLGGETATDKLLTVMSKKSFKNLSEQDVTLIRAALANEMAQDLANRGKKSTLQAVFSHPAYRIFSKNEDGTYRIALDNLDTTDLEKNLSTMFKSMDEMKIVQYLADLKAQDEIISGLKQTGVKKTIDTAAAAQPDFLKKTWNGVSEMLLRKTTALPKEDFKMPKVSKDTAKKLMVQLQKAFPNIPIEFGKLPDGVRGIVSPFGGKLIIDESKMTPTTSVHEFGHVWIMHAKAEQPEIYSAMANAVKKSPYFDTVQATYKDIYKNEDEFIDEAIAHAIEDAGARFFNKIERKSFMDKFVALMQSIVNRFKYTDIDALTDDTVSKMFNTKGTPISEKSLAQMDILQFNKEDFDKTSYFIRHVIQKISEDDLFTKFAKGAKTVSEQEFIYQIINSMIKNQVPSKNLASTVENYMHGFNDYIQLVEKDAFTEAYVKSEIAKLETNAVLRSMVEDHVKNTSALHHNINKGGVSTTDKYINELDKALMAMARNLGLKRVFGNGSTANFVNELQNTISAIKNSDMSLVQKQKALTEQSLAYSNEFITTLLDKVVGNKEIGYSYKINGQKVTIKPEQLYAMLQVMRMPEFAGSQLGIKEFLANKNIKANLKKYHDITASKIRELNVNGAERTRIVSQIPVEEVPVNKNTVIITSESRNPDITYAHFDDENGKYMTISRFLETELSPDTNYLVSANFFARSVNNPEMQSFLDKTREAKNVYPVAFSVVQAGGKNMVEVNGYDQLKRYFSIKYTTFEMPNFDFEYAPSTRGLSRLSENSANTQTRKELGEILDDTYTENPKAEEVLKRMGANPVAAPTVDEKQLIHSFGEIGRVGEIFRTVLTEFVEKANRIKTKAGDINENAFLTSDKTIITDNIKNEYLDSLVGTEDLGSIYIKGKTASELIDNELLSVDTQSFLQDITDKIDDIESMKIQDTEFTSVTEFNTYKEQSLAQLNKAKQELETEITNAKQASLKDTMDAAKYASGKEAFNEIVDLLKEEGLSYSKISSILKTIATENPAWKKDILDSNAIEFLPSFDSFIAARMASPLLAKYGVDPVAFRTSMEEIYKKVHNATFKKNFPENDSIIQLFLKSLQKFEVLDQTDDVLAIAKNLDPDTKKALHEIINNIYVGDFQKAALDESTETYATSTFNQLYRRFAQSMKKDVSSSDKEALNEMSGGGTDEDGMFSTDTSITTFEGKAYAQVMRDFIQKLEDYHNFEFEAMLPENYVFGETTGKPLFESNLNLNVWASQADHRVAKETPAEMARPVSGATKEKVQARSTMVKAYNVFNSKSVDTVNRYREIAKFDTFEKLPFKTKEGLEELMQKAGLRIQTQVSDMSEELLGKALNKAEKDLNTDKIDEINEFIKDFKGDDVGLALRERMRAEYSFMGEYYASNAKPHLDKKSEVIGRMLGRVKQVEKEGGFAEKAEIKSKLLNNILTNVINTLEAYKLRRLTDGAKDIEVTPIFSMVTPSGAKRSYYLNTLLNSPIFRVYMREAGNIKFSNPLMQILEYGKFVDKKILEASAKEKNKIGTLPFQGLARKIRKIEKLYGETIGKETIDQYEYTNSLGEIVTRYGGDDDNISAAKEYITEILALEFKTPVEIIDITGFTPIKVEGEGFDFNLSKHKNIVNIEDIEYGKIYPQYIDSYDFKFIYRDSKTNEVREAWLESDSKQIDNEIKNTIFLTKEEFDKETEKLKNLKTNKRLQIAQQMKEAREYGDLSENAEWQEAVSEYNKNEKLIQKISASLAISKVVSDIKSSITIEKLGVTKTYKIAASSDYLHGVISFNAPIVKEALNGGKEYNGAKIVSFSNESNLKKKSEQNKRKKDTEPSVSTYSSNGMIFKKGAIQTEIVEIPKKVNKIDEDFTSFADVATCELPL